MAASRESLSNAAPSDLLHLLSAEWREGGRSIEDGLDCLGVTLEAARIRGIPYVDPWEQCAERWARGERDARKLFEFPAGWVQTWPASPIVPRNAVVIFSLLEDDVVPGHIGFAIEVNQILTSREGAGVYIHPVQRIRSQIVEVWEWRGEADA